MFTVIALTAATIVINEGDNTLFKLILFIFIYLVLTLKNTVILQT